MKVLVLALGILASASQAHVELTFSTINMVTQGEPVVVTYRFRNLGTDPIGLQWGAGEQGFFRIELQGPTGSKTLEPANLGSFVVPLNTLAPKRAFGEPLILNQ